ncbi:hypothetical protein [Paraburkholderia diazotrophica]|uniref:Uncharacterized protein n=1 Tax=Paraburkholderia diazotrophica TaxID=667676 RepID=A0A1H6V2U1_9BURK|nr:hypothetical protein [Paraburkholderia diazotrophica]SEI96167.1 hypothetical protein SAMN05192539_1005207 [Paraburkholderia diazotrophica]
MLAIAGATLVVGIVAEASTLDRLARRGFGVVEETQVNGEFQGCESGRRIPFMDGLIFVCSGYSYHYSYSPEALILKSVRTGEIRVLIDDEEFDGTVYKR